MKFTLAFLFSFFVVSGLQAEFKIYQHGRTGFRIAKYTYDGGYVLDDVQRDRIIATASKASHTVTSDDFINSLPSAYDIALITSSINGAQYIGDGIFYCKNVDCHNEANAILNDKSYVENLLIDRKVKQAEEQKRQDVAISLGITRTKKDYSGEVEMLKKRHTELNK